MSALLFLAIAGAAMCAALLLVRLQQVDTELHELLSPILSGDAWGGEDTPAQGPSGEGPGTDRIALSHALRDHVRRELLPAADGIGLRSVPVRATEPHDAARNARDLLAHFVTLPRPREPREHEARIKALYQISHSFGLDDTCVQELLQPAMRDLLGEDWMGREVRAIERVSIGDTIDRETMWPLSTGTRVRYPIGVVIRGPDGKVLSRAKVICS